MLTDDMWEFKHPSKDYSFMLDNDGRVVYGYLQNGNKFIADVWLYNVCPTPQEPEWRDKSKLPFANPRDYALENPYGPIESIDEVSVEWIDDDPVVVLVYIKGVLWAKLVAGAKPGWCILAKKDGPLARVFEGSGRE